MVSIETDDSFFVNHSKFSIMHNIGRTVYETDETNEFGQEFEGQFENQGYETNEANVLGEAFQELNGSHEFEEESDGENEIPFSETTEMELASELLEIQTEEEFGKFMSRFMNRSAGGGGGRGGNFAGSPKGRMLGGVLKKVAKFALPLAGKVVGGMFGGPIGAQLGSKLGSLTGRVFGLELEGLSAEDREFEISKAFLRFAGNAVKRLIQSRGQRSGGDSSPQSMVRGAVTGAARRFAPGLLQPMNYGGRGYADQPYYRQNGYSQPDYGQYGGSGGGYDDGNGGGQYAGGGGQYGGYEGGEEGAQEAPLTNRQGGRWRRSGNRIVLHGV